MSETRKSGPASSMTKDLTQGSVTRQLIVFAMPLFVANALQAVYNLVDMVVVGQVIGGAGMSAVSIGGPLVRRMGARAEERPRRMRRTRCRNTC